MNRKFKIGDYVYFMNYEIIRDGIPRRRVSGIEPNYVHYMPAYFWVYMDVSDNRKKGLSVTDNYIKRKIRESGYLSGLVSHDAFEYVLLFEYFVGIPRFTFFSYSEAEKEYELFLRVCYYYKGKIILYHKDFNNDFNIRPKFIMGCFFK